MSIRTWKEEFYPKRAQETTKAEALDHSILKWVGLRPEPAPRSRTPGIHSRFQRLSPHGGLWIYLLGPHEIPCGAEPLMCARTC